MFFPKMAQKEYLEILKIQVGNGIFQMNGSGVTHIQILALISTFVRLFQLSSALKRGFTIRAKVTCLRAEG